MQNLVQPILYTYTVCCYRVTPREGDCYDYAEIKNVTDGLYQEAVILGQYFTTQTYGQIGTLQAEYQAWDDEGV